MKIKSITNNPFQENTYIVWDETTKEAAIIDCGALMPAEQATIAGFIKDNGLTVCRLLNTHLHLDHCFGNHWASTTYGVKPEAHEADSHYITHFREQLDAFGLPFDVEAEPIGNTLNDNDIVVVGNERLRVIHTPGHTPGGICFYNETDDTVITGDTLFCESIGRADLDGGCYSDLIKSIQSRLLSLPDDTKVYCGHGPYTTIGHERKNNPFL